MAIVPSYTWAGGWLSEGLWGRVDLNKYMTGLSHVENFVISAEGGIDKRFGMYFVGYPKLQNSAAKLVRWKLADDDSYALLFGQEYVRFIRFGGFVKFPVPGPFIPDPDSDAVNIDGFVEVPTPYQAEHVRELKFTFANDYVYIFHKLYPPAQLKRLGLYDWEYVVTEFNPHAAAPAGLTVVWERNNATGSAAANWQTADMNQGNYDESRDDIFYRVSATMPDGLESLACAPVSVSSDLGSPAFRNNITWTAVPGAVRYTIYKGKAGIYGFIGYVDAPDTFFYDENFAPSYEVVPVVEFEGFSKDLVTPPAEYPRVGEFRKQRLAYAASARKTQTLWFSKPLFFNALSTSIPLQDDDGIVVPLVGRERHTINHLVELKKFFIFTDSAEWVVETTQNQALTAATIDPVILTKYGSDPYLAPLVIGNRILFPQNISGTIFDMGYELTADDYKADDLSRLARDLFKGKRIQAWCYANHPYNLVWTALDDGSFPAMTYLRQHEIWGWALNTTQGKVLDVVSTPEFDQDATYFQVEREINGVKTLTIERLDVKYTSRIEELCYLDCSLSYQFRFIFTNLIVDDTGLHVTFNFSGEDGDIPPPAIGDEVQLESTDGKLIWRIRVEFTTSDEIQGSPVYDRPMPEGFPTSGYAFRCGDLLTGYTHLANQTGISVLADGNVYTDLTVSNAGTIQLPIQAARAHGGFPYDALAITLGMDVQGAAGAGALRSFNGMWLRLQNSRGVHAGPANRDYADLPAIESRSTEDMDQPNRPLNGLHELVPPADWDRDLKMKIWAPYPLPCNIRNVVVDINYGN